MQLLQCALPKPATTRLRPVAPAFAQNEKKEVKVDEILGADVARKAVSDAMVRLYLLRLCGIYYSSRAAIMIGKWLCLGDTLAFAKQVLHSVADITARAAAFGRARVGAG